MGRKTRTYHKLAGSGLSLILKHSLWQGADHLLWVEGGFVQEHYRRFYFKDIQAVVLHPTRRQTLWALVWSLFVLLFTAIMLFNPGPAYFSGVMAFLGVIALVINWRMGTGCEVFLQTAVQLEKLSTLVRIKKAVNVMDRIRSMAEAAQGPLSEQAIAGLRASGELRKSWTASGRPAAIPSVASVHGEVHEAYDPRLHWLLFGVFAIFGILRCARIWLKIAPLTVVDLIGLVFSLVLAIIAIARWRAQVKGSLLSLASWLALVFAVVHGVAAYAIFIAASIHNPGMAYDHWAILKAFFHFYTGNQPIVRAVVMGIALASLGMGLLGFIAIYNYGHGRPMRSPSVPEGSPVSGHDPV